MKYTNRKLNEILGVELNHKEKQTIRGGEEIYPPCFNCICRWYPNPPYSGKWFGCYDTTEEMEDEITQFCHNGEGTCTARDDGDQ